MRPQKKRACANWLKEVYFVSERRACRVVSMYRSTLRYEKKDKLDGHIRMAIRDIAQSRPRYGYRRITTLLRRDGFEINHKKVYRIYKEEGLQVRTKRRKKTASKRRVSLPRPKRINHTWSMDFVHDRLMDQSKIRMLTIVDHFSRESVAIEVARGLKSQEVIRCLSRLKHTRGLPKAIVVDNGSEFVSNEMDYWAHQNGVELCFTRPGKPTDNAYIESFNGRLRDECLNTNVFYSLDDAREIIERWREDYNNWRPHSSLGNQTPVEYRKKNESTESFGMTQAS